MIFEELENNVVDWGIRKGILGDLELDSEIDTRKKKQLLKFEEEAGEMVEAVLNYPSKPMGFVLNRVFR